jgi:hypothetical protein
MFPDRVLLILLFLPALVRTRALLRRAGRAAHHGAAFLDHVAGICGPVFVRLQPAAGITFTLERVGIGLLFGGAAATAAEDAVKEAHGRSL